MVTASYGTIICSNRHQCKARFHDVCCYKQWLTNMQYTFPHGECRMSILTKTSRRRTCSEGYFYLQRKVSKSNQLQSQCCKQDPYSDKRLHCMKSSKKGVVADFISYKESGRHLANTTIKAQPYKRISANEEVSLPFHIRGFLLAERKKMPGRFLLTKHPFCQSQTRTSSRLSTISLPLRNFTTRSSPQSATTKPSVRPLQGISSVQLQPIMSVNSSYSNIAL